MVEETKKEMLEALREFAKEKEVIRNKNIEALTMIIRATFTVMIYIFWWHFKNTPSLQSHLFIWAVGAWTAISVWDIIDFCENKKKEVINGKGRNEKRS